MGDILRKLNMLCFMLIVHAGVELLSMSKRIMNNVFDASYGCGVKIHY